MRLHAPLFAEPTRQGTHARHPAPFIKPQLHSIQFCYYNRQDTIAKAQVVCGVLHCRSSTSTTIIFLQQSGMCAVLLAGASTIRQVVPQRRSHARLVENNSEHIIGGLGHKARQQSSRQYHSTPCARSQHKRCKGITKTTNANSPTIGCDVLISSKPWGSSC